MYCSPKHTSGVKAINQIFIAFVVLVFFTSTSAFAQVFVTNGSASFVGGSCYQLTPDAGGLAGSIFSENPIDLTMPFSEDATFFFGCKDVNGADGIVFILATTNTALGGGGGSIGYEGITPSIAVEYDDYFNGAAGDPAADHMAVISMGSINHTLPSNLVGPITLPNIEDCTEHCFAVVWDPMTQTLTCSLDGELISYTGDIVNTIFSGVTQVYYGFSSGTGGLSNVHRVCFGPPQLEPMADLSVCEGESIDLQADDNGLVWTWAPNPTLSPLNVSDPTATPTVTTDYMVTIEYACGYFNQDTVQVTVFPMPEAEADNDGPVCQGETLTLTADGGTSYEWEGPSGFSSFVQEPSIQNITTANEGLYTVTVTDAAGCTDIATTFVMIDTGPDIEVDPVPMPLCENNGPIQLTASPGGGYWEGDITPGGLFDPEYVGVGISIVTYTSTNANGCSNTVDVAIEVSSIPDVSIVSPGVLCEGSAPIQMTGSPTGGIWEGDITLNGIFNPVTAGSGPHLITYTANDANGCTNSSEIVVEVDAVMTATITPQGPFCGGDTITLMANPPGGVWGGAAHANGQIYPNELSEGSHLVTYQLNDTSGCYDSQINIDIHYPQVLSCPGTIQLCFNSSPVLLHANPSGGVWSGAASSSGLVDPSMLAPGSYIAMYTLGTDSCSGGANTCMTNVEILDAPNISNISFSCDSLSTFYAVSFSLTGGDTSSYQVIGTANGIVIPGVPYHFVSDPIPAGNNFSFILDDNYHCEADTATGTHLCNCGTNAGSMDLNLISACEDDTVFVMPPSGLFLDPNDTLVYILHTGNPDSLLMTGSPDAFTFKPPLLINTVYYISAVAGNTLPGFGVDTLDPCRSVSLGTPVIWRSRPEVTVTGPAEICANDSALVTFHLMGGGPFDFLFIEGGALFGDTLTGVDSGFSMYIQPIPNAHYAVIDLIDQTGCKNFFAGEFFSDVLDISTIQEAVSICAGDSIILAGSFQTQSGNYVDTLISVTGCDSIIQTTLTVLAKDTTYIDDTSCDPMQTGVFVVTKTNQSGCDSIIITTITFAPADTTQIQSFTCDMQDAGVFNHLLVTQEGCDSLVIETIAFIPSDTTLLSSKTCDTATAGTFIRILNNAAGCDSLIIETIAFVEADTTILNGETCDLASAGTFTQIFSNADGCDSIIIETIHLLPSDTLTDYALTCFPEDTGTIKLVYANIYGCDSLVFIVTSLLPYDSCHEMVIPKNIYFPNIFSPNGDGVNDVFFIFSNQGSVSNIPYFRIFDRWGGLVLERNDIQPNDPLVGWDGTEKGKAASPGVYVWTAMIEHTDGKVEILTGDVTLIR